MYIKWFQKIFHYWVITWSKTYIFRWFFTQAQRNRERYKESKSTQHIHHQILCSYVFFIALLVYIYTGGRRPCANVDKQSCWCCEGEKPWIGQTSEILISSRDEKVGEIPKFEDLSLPPPLLIFLSAVQTIHGHFSEAFNKDRKNIFITKAFSRNCLSAFTNKKFNIIPRFVLSLLPGVVLILWWHILCSCCCQE